MCYLRRVLSLGSWGFCEGREDVVGFGLTAWVWWFGRGTGLGVGCFDFCYEGLLGERGNGIRVTELFDRFS